MSIFPAGLKEGDIVTALNDTAIASSAELITAMEAYEAGDTITLTVYRDGETVTADVKLDEKNNESTQALQDYVAKKEQEQAAQQQQQQRPSSGGNINDFYDFFWPFGNMNPWGF